MLLNRLAGIGLLLAGRNLCRILTHTPENGRFPHKLRVIINHFSKCNMWSEHANKSKPQPRIGWIVLIKVVGNSSTSGSTGAAEPVHVCSRPAATLLIF